MSLSPWDLFMWLNPGTIMAIVTTVGLLIIPLQYAAFYSGYDWTSWRQWYNERFNSVYIVLDGSSSHLQVAVWDYVRSLKNEREHLVFTRTASEWFKDGQYQLMLRPSDNCVHGIRYEGITICAQAAYDGIDPYTMHGQLKQPTMSLFVKPWQKATLDRFMAAAYAMYSRKQEERIRVWTMASQANWSQEYRQNRTFAHLTYSTTVDELISDARTWHSPRTREYYRANDIPYRRGYLLHGVPGCGKSSWVMALATDLSCPIFYVRCETRESESRFLGALESVGRGEQCAIVLLEDIDRLMPIGGDADDEGSEKKRTTTISVSAILNALDGVMGMENVIVVATTNHLDKVDAAVRRPGRMDRVCFFGPPGEEQIDELCTRLIADDDQKRRELSALIKAAPAPALTQAEIQSMAQLIYYDKNKWAQEAFNEVIGARKAMAA